MKETIQTAAESFLPALWAMSRAMYDHPELGLEEVNSSRMLREWLAEQGFKVEENFHGLPTAFRAVYGSGRPVLGFLCEYDALPEVGGNNKLQTTSLQAWRRCALGEHWDTEIRHSLFLQWDMAVWA